jgi:signal transduction histidine kinase
MATIRPEKALQEPLDLPLTESLYEDAFESAPHGLAVLSAVKASRKGEDQLLQQLGDAALSAAHEIGNTLTPLMMNAEMLLEHATKKEVRDAAHQVFMAARRIAFVLRRMRGVEGAPKVAYVGSERMLDLARIAPLDRASGQG